MTLSGSLRFAVPSHYLVWTAIYHHVYNTYRYLRAAREHQKMSRQHREALGYTTRAPFSLGFMGGAPQQALGTLLDISLSHTKETEAIARLAGLRLNEVTVLALILEGLVLSTQNFISAVVGTLVSTPARRN